MRIRTGFSLAVILAAGLAACGRTNGSVDAGNTMQNMDSGTDTDAGSGPATYTKTSVTNAWASLAALSGSAVEIDGAVVVAENHYNSTSSKCTTETKAETFYIQDSSGGPGIAVYHACTDMGDYPSVGDVVNVLGRLAKFDGSLQISSSTKYMIALGVTVTGHNGMATSGAYPPAGMPTNVASADQAGYAHTAAEPHPEQLGTALHFDGISVTNMYPTGFTYTRSDGGVSPEGFEISNGVWVDDSVIYSNCIKGTVPDGGTLPLTGVTGMWDRYQDYYGRDSDGGYSPVVPVLIPQSCSDLMMSTDAGTTDAGSMDDAGTTDAGSSDAGASDASVAG